MKASTGIFLRAQFQAHCRDTKHPTETDSCVFRLEFTKRGTRTATESSRDLCTCETDLSFNHISSMLGMTLENICLLMETV
jgi:hypothetical protein